MEDLLLTIIQDANSARLTSLKDTTQVAYGKCFPFRDSSRFKSKYYLLKDLLSDALDLFH